MRVDCRAERRLVDMHLCYLGPSGRQDQPFVKTRLILSYRDATRLLMRAIQAIRPGFGVRLPNGVTDKYKTMKINASGSFSSSADRPSDRVDGTV
jgi:hypothetical protein